MRKVVSSGQPTIKEIAKRLNISVSTVSRALHDHHSIGLKTKARVKELAAELNYERNQTAVYFQQGKTFTIGILLPELSEAFFSSAISGIEDTAYSNNYTVLLGQSHDDEDREKQIIQSMKQHRVDGCIVSIGKNTRNYEHFEMLRQARIPVVFFDRVPDLPNIHAVSVNLESGTIQAVDFLLKKGHRVIGMINGPEQLVASKERATGYIKALRKHRLKYDPELIVNADLTAAGTDSAMEYLLSLKRKVTAIVTFNDYVAMDAVQYALKRKLEINKDITFVSYANTPVSGYTAFPPAASVEQFPYEQGQAATNMLLSLLNGEHPLNDYTNTIMESQLVIHNR
ncbi:LacI family DNA-binding transcriptional regulator [Chitinophaga qingshengii]|uniref:LacI family DNA-binding transcriptional regulator n=1 Tax=Chitinophaga qingshengii TaxID=1569794 RepID=A0ABR7THY3_9BACT|nr:LacI family DNA-binding transcriptional regulator [Chitinophaga qingshengii]MBC9929568.1 LacI family DNA-binding transcriptional regulator [Chitinophaga qingshengii]